MIDQPNDAHWVEVGLPSGRTVLVRAASAVPEAASGPGALRDVAFGDLKITTMIDTLCEIGGLVRAGIEPLLPHEATVELALGVNAKTGKLFAVFGEAGVDSAVKVTLKWTFEARHNVSP